MAGGWGEQSNSPAFTPHTEKGNEGCIWMHLQYFNINPCVNLCFRLSLFKVLDTLCKVPRVESPPTFLQAETTPFTCSVPSTEPTDNPLVDTPRRACQFNFTNPLRHACLDAVQRRCILNKIKVKQAITSKLIFTTDSNRTLTSRDPFHRAAEL